MRSEVGLAALSLSSPSLLPPRTPGIFLHFLLPVCVCVGEVGDFMVQEDPLPDRPWPHSQGPAKLGASHTAKSPNWTQEIAL